ncbi:unnamed protein product [Rangifer tarandus platyrhynchus]|uniref:Uncharacterized protein n=2 Tax=Rangifer tarandus platyrhynchus TaxID=3082113 RepID=A0ABN8YS09_RANTA|nr:unnamed protein product [Rangifer tarandus platyrhynchus]CAI9701658.1 unnamed protein product [Rangifer tarandus platyrhynchus]
MVISAGGSEMWEPQPNIQMRPTRRSGWSVLLRHLSISWSVPKPSPAGSELREGRAVATAKAAAAPRARPRGTGQTARNCGPAALETIQMPRTGPRSDRFQETVFGNVSLNFTCI